MKVLEQFDAMVAAFKGLLLKTQHDVGDTLQDRPVLAAKEALAQAPVLRAQLAELAEEPSQAKVNVVASAIANEFMAQIPRKTVSRENGDSRVEFTQGCEWKMNPHRIAKAAIAAFQRTGGSYAAAERDEGKTGGWSRWN